MSESQSARREPSAEVESLGDGESLLTIATWNVNSIKARLAAVQDWLATTRPDILCAQELKCETDSFPHEALAEIGYKAEVSGQKSYNGVALIHRHTASNVENALPGDPNDKQARYLEADIAGIRVICLYAPNGNPVAPGNDGGNDGGNGEYSEKYRYKLAWMERLHDRLAKLLADQRPLAVCGDYNVIPAPIDCYDPQAWKHDALFLPETRRTYRRIEHLGFYDAFRALHPDVPGAYTFWDYQAGAWQHNHGIRIDHALLSPQAADRLDSARIDVEPRGREKASDHTPLIVSLRQK